MHLNGFVATKDDGRVEKYAARWLEDHPTQVLRKPVAFAKYVLILAAPAPSIGLFEDGWAARPFH